MPQFTMPHPTVEGAKALVRPTITVLLVASQSGLAFMWATSTETAIVATEAAFAALTPFTMMAMTFWFVERKGNGGG